MGNVRQPAVAGQFYPEDPEELRGMITGYLEEARADLPMFEGKPRALVLPHAGYVFSGPVAAYGFETLREQEYDTVIIIAVSHVTYFDGIHVYNGDGYKTPFGTVPVNRGKVARLHAASERFGEFLQAERGEHSVEVMVPWLQEVLGEGFTLVDIILSGDAPDDWQVLADALAGIVDDKTLVIASSDLTHYPNYTDSVYADTKTLNAILTGEPDTLISTIDGLEAEDLANTDTMACGEKGILAVMQMARTLGIPDITLLHQANSGDIEGYGDKDRVVGYGTILFSGGTLAEAEPVDETIPFTGDEVLNAAERQEALVMVRETLRQHLYEGEEAEFTPEQAIFYEPLGAFVTLNEGGNLRGCIGQFEPDQPLWIVLRDMAIAAASEDSRFIPVAPDEFDAIEIEISVLSPMQQITDPYTEIEIGRHGVYVKKNGRSGTYLPQVATDNGWDLETFMNSLCGQKAGIGADSWKDGSAEIYVYSAQVFGE